jgi:hypothetical protein
LSKTALALERPNSYRAALAKPILDQFKSDAKCKKAEILKGFMELAFN